MTPSNNDAINAMTKQVEDAGFAVISHKRWLQNEYQLWIKALQESTVHNFKEHPQVQRMLSEDVNPSLFRHLYGIQHQLLAIDNVGREVMKPVSGACLRMAHYALKALETGCKSVVEIGGGVGQFYAVLKVLGYDGEYGIIDLPEVMKFQREYLDEVEKRTGLLLPLVQAKQPDMVVSFYAFGEFDDETKAKYLPLIQSVPHGLILWNPHSGASSDIPFECNIDDENPKTGNENVKMLTW